MPTKLYTSKAWLYKKYVSERLNEHQIAELAGTNQSTINRWLKKHSISRGPK